MAKSSMKIVLVDPLGDIIFSGDSLIGTALTDEEDEKPPVKVSGIYPRAKMVTDAEEDEEATASSPSHLRVA